MVALRDEQIWAQRQLLLHPSWELGRRGPRHVDLPGASDRCVWNALRSAIGLLIAIAIDDHARHACEAQAGEEQDENDEAERYDFKGTVKFLS